MDSLLSYVLDQVKSHPLVLPFVVLILVLAAMYWYFHHKTQVGTFIGWLLKGFRWAPPLLLTGATFYGSWYFDRPQLTSNCAVIVLPRDLASKNARTHNWAFGCLMAKTRRDFWHSASDYLTKQWEEENPGQIADQTMKAIKEKIQGGKGSVDDLSSEAICKIVHYAGKSEGGSEPTPVLANQILSASVGQRNNCSQQQ